MEHRRNRGIITGMRKWAVVALLLGGCEDEPGPEDAGGTSGESTGAAASESSSSTTEPSESSDGYPMYSCIVAGCECAERGHCRMRCLDVTDCWGEGQDCMPDGFCKYGEGAFCGDAGTCVGCGCSLCGEDGLCPHWPYDPPPN
jgi:hypothetical protein